jgi:hypothetical protein
MRRGWAKPSRMHRITFLLLLPLWKWALLIISIVATARERAVAYVAAALPVGVALNDRKPDDAAVRPTVHLCARLCARLARMNMRLFGSAERF